MNLKFTPYKKEYFEQSAMLMSKTWHFNQMLENPKDTSLIYKVYFQESLLESQYTDFIVDENGQVLGYLLASAPNLVTPSSALRSKLSELWLMIELTGHIALGSLGSRQQALATVEAANDLSKETHKDAEQFDSEVVLFFISDELRGQGCGRKLMERYYDFCRRNDICKIFLSTDLACNFGFYDHHGFERHREFHHECLARPEEEYNGFIYSKTIQ